MQHGPLSKVHVGDANERLLVARVRVFAPRLLYKQMACFKSGKASAPLLDIDTHTHTPCPSNL